MSKRAQGFERRPRDFYPTPREAVVPLIPHLTTTVYTEPCAGDGSLIDHLREFGQECVSAYDIEPRRSDIRTGDALTDMPPSGVPVITNPPWDRKILHPLILHLSSQVPTWLLFDADWMHTKQSSEYIRLCRKIVSVGRVKWIPDSKFVGKDNAAWYLFDASLDTPTTYIGR